MGNGRAMRRKAAVNYKATKILGSTVTAPRRRVKAVFPFTYITRVYNFDTSVELSVEDVEMLQKRREMELLRSILPPGNRQEMFAKMLEILNKQQSHEAERRTRHAHRPKKDAITALHSECIAPIEDPLLVAIRHNRLEEVYANLVSGKSYVADSHIQQAIQSNVSFEIAELLFCKYLNTFIVWRDAEGKNSLTPFSNYSPISDLFISTEASTFLHLMAKLNRFPLMPVLHRWQPDLLNSKDRKGRTPLHVACINGHFESIKTLIGLGCDKNVKDAVSQLLFCRVFVKTYLFNGRMAIPLCFGQSKLLLSVPWHCSMEEQTHLLPIGPVSRRSTGRCCGATRVSRGSSWSAAFGSRTDRWRTLRRTCLSVSSAFPSSSICDRWRTAALTSSNIPAEAPCLCLVWRQVPLTL